MNILAESVGEQHLKASRFNKVVYINDFKINVQANFLDNDFLLAKLRDLTINLTKGESTE